MLTRRQFLHAAGISVAAAHAPNIAVASTPTHFTAQYGRALTTAAIHAAPNAVAPLVARLWSDAITPIFDTTSGWYRLPDGYARRADVQPLVAPPRRAAMTATPPFWGEVTDAVAIIREWCAADAPTVARVGHGGVLRVTDLLPRSTPDGIDWYGVADQADVLLGWTQAAAWSPAEIEDVAPSLALKIDTVTQTLTALDGNRSILTAPVSTGHDLAPGAYPITDRQPTHSADHYGAAWSLMFSGMILSGVYWHNHFGTPHAGSTVQVTPALAKWLYSRAATVILY